jgi:nicotinate phosphoribosyltransferase
MRSSDTLIDGLSRMARPSLCPWDDYYCRMAQSDWMLGRHESFASKAYFIRKAPFGGSYALLGGVTDFLRQINTYRFTADVAEVLGNMGYRREFTHFLKDRWVLPVTVRSLPEGSIFFPHEPAVVLGGPLWAVRLAEGMLLECVNYPSLAMTKWSRVCAAAGSGYAMEFARRRTHDHCRTSLYAYLAGAAVSSNAEIRSWFEIPVVGTMGHEWVQSHGVEFRAFDAWLECNPDRPVLLVDTVDTLSSGVPNAILAFSKHREKIKKAGGIPGIRLDSGDLAFLAMESFKMLQNASIEGARIFMTNDLDEYSIQAIKTQIQENCSHLGLDPQDILRSLVWACGTKPGTCWDQPSIGGVAKLTSIKGPDEPVCNVIKLALDNPVKTSIPGRNCSATLIGQDELLSGILIFNKDKDTLESIEEFVHPDDGSKRTDILSSWEVTERQVTYTQPPVETLEQIRIRVQQNLSLLHWTQRRIDKPHTVRVGLSPYLFEIRQHMIKHRMLTTY